MKRSPARRIFQLVTATLALGVSPMALAATGEMGTGRVHFGVYAKHQYTTIWSVTEAVRPFPQGCAQLILSAGTVGNEGYKIALSQLTAAKLAGKRIRLYSHAETDGGCGIDYVEIID